MTIDAPHRPIPVDDLARTEHAYLSAADQCWYLACYVPGSGHRAGEVNRLIANLKSLPSDAALNRRRALHKQRAINAAAAMMRSALTRDLAEDATWVPIPPSRALRDPDFDDRLARIIRRAFAGYDLDVRNLLYQAVSTASDHLGERRISMPALYERIHVNWHALEARPVRTRLVLFDDVLTTGKHFKCCERRLRRVMPDISISGMFVARRALSGRWRYIP
jgi:hypothetical protein